MSDALSNASLEALRRAAQLAKARPGRLVRVPRTAWLELTEPAQQRAVDAQRQRQTGGVLFPDEDEAKRRYGQA